MTGFGGVRPDFSRNSSARLPTAPWNRVAPRLYMDMDDVRDDVPEAADLQDYY